jgi:hypothetical protein
VLREPPHAIAHDVGSPKAGLLDQLMRERLQTDTCPVYSRHHQAPMTLGTGLVASATAPDGVIEAIEDPGKRFLPRRAVAPREFLSHRRIPFAVRGLRGGGGPPSSYVIAIPVRRGRLQAALIVRRP